MAAGGRLVIVRGAVKSVALAAGFVTALVCLMAGVGRLSESGWVRLPVALLVMVVLPAVLADRLLPDDEPTKGRGIVGDVFAVSWLLVVVIFVVPLAGVSSGWLRAEGDRLHRSEFTLLSRLAYALAGAEVHVKAAPVVTADSASAAGSAPAAPRASASASAVVPPVEDAGAPTPRPKQSGEKTAAELFKQLAPSVVSINIKSGDMEGGGTGFLVDTKGTVVTNHHVVSVGKEIRIKFFNGAVYDQVDLLEQDPAQDLALLAIDLAKPKEGKRPKIEALSLGDSDKVQVGERAISIGNPLGLEHTLTDGLVSARRVYQGKHWIQMSVPVSPGNSGGPLFDMKGQVIGVTTAQVLGGFFGRAQNLNLAIPVNVVKQHLKSTYPDRRKFGSEGGGSHW